MWVINPDEPFNFWVPLWSHQVFKTVFESLMWIKINLKQVNLIRPRPHFSTAERNLKTTAFSVSFHFENGLFTLKTPSNASFSFTLCRRNLKTQQSTSILDLCLRKPRSGNSYDYSDLMVFEWSRAGFHYVFLVHTKTQMLSFHISSACINGTLVRFVWIFYSRKGNSCATFPCFGSEIKT